MKKCTHGACTLSLIVDNTDRRMPTTTVCFVVALALLEVVAGGAALSYSWRDSLLFSWLPKEVFGEWED